MRITTAVLLAGFLLATLAWGQGTTAQINGTVKDASVLAVPGAEIKATQTATGQTRTATSGTDGAFLLPNLPIGPYLMEVTKEGFAKYAQSGIVLQVDASPTIDVAMKVGNVTDQVTVQADANLVETHSTNVGTVVDNQRVLEMPLNGRNATELIFLAGMANLDGNNGFLNNVRNYPTIVISIGGAVGNWTNFLFDGANHNDAYNSMNLPLPFPDALQEFKVESSGLPAQYGVHAGATVNVVTKSGTNAFHGDAFEFLRNGDLNARDYFAASRDSIKRNQYGGTVGGRIKRDKLFFFAGVQDTSLKSNPTSNSSFVPTPAMLNGDFTTFASAACNSGKSYTLSPTYGFVNNTIAPSLLDPAALKVTALLPTAQATPCGQVFYPLANSQRETMGVGKIDYQKSDKQSMYIRAYATDLLIPATLIPGNALTLNSNTQHDRVYALAYGDTYLINANMVNSFRLGANRSEIPKVPSNLATWAQLGVNAVSLDTEPRFTISGGNGFGIGGGNAIINHDQGGPNPSINNDFSWIRGNHQMGFGVSYLHSLLNYASGINATGLFTFNGTLTGLGMGDFLTGNATTWAQGNVNTFTYNRQNYIGLYAQDSWKITPRLTVNYGLRYEPYLPVSNKYPFFDHFDPGFFAQGIHSQQYTTTPAGLVFPGDPQWLPSGNQIATDRWGAQAFLPRVGVVWDPIGDGKTTIRASVGMFTDRGSLYSMSAMAQDAPFGSVISVPNVKLDNPWATFAGGNPIPVALTKNVAFPGTSSMVTDNMHEKPIWVNSFNFGITRQLGSSWLLQANYVGNTVSHLQIENQINPALYLGTGPCSFPAEPGLAAASFPNCGTTASTNYRRVLYQQNPAQGSYYGIVSVFDDGGTSSYNGLYLAANKRLSNGLTVLSNYTWSHCIGDLFNGDPGNNGVYSVTPGNTKYDRSNCQGTDYRSVFNLSLVATTPKMSNRVLNTLFSNWQFAPILKLKSAIYYTVGTGVDTALNGEGGQRANAVPGVNPYASNPAACSQVYCVQWANPAAYVSPALGTLGTLSPYSLKGPGQFQLDLAVSRTFKVLERASIQFRAEAFNLPNHVNLAVPGTTGPSVSSATSFAITSDISGTSGLTARRLSRDSVLDEDHLLKNGEESTTGGSSPSNRRLPRFYSGDQQQLASHLAAFEVAVRLRSLGQRIGLLNAKFEFA